MMVLVTCIPEVEVITTTTTTTTTSLPLFGEIDVSSDSEIIVSGGPMVNIGTVTPTQQRIFIITNSGEANLTLSTVDISGTDSCGGP